MTLLHFNQHPIPSVFDRFLNTDLFDLASRNFSRTNMQLPSVNIKETDDAYELDFAASGFEKSNFKVEIHNNMLTVSSEKKDENEKKDSNRFTKREFCYQSFIRSFTLPDLVDEEKIDATYQNGILCVTVPKKEAEKPKETCTIDVK